MTASAGASTTTATAAELLARQDRIPVWALPRYYLVIIGAGYFFTFYDIADIGYGLPAIAEQFHLTSSQGTFVALSVGLIGYVVGSIVIGTLADRFGRYRVLLFTIALTALGSFLDATSTGLVTLSLWRFVTGMGVGADLNLVSTYVGELAPAAKRGRIANVTFIVGIIGQAVTPFVALGLVPNYDYGWRLLFVIGGVIATIAFVARFELPESPRWLALHGREADAEAVIEQMEATARARGVVLEEAEPTEVSSAYRRFAFADLLQRPYVGRLAVLIPMWFLWYIGNYGFLGDSAALFADQGHDLGNSILYLGIGAVGYPLGAGLMALIADRVERRLLIFCATLVWLAGMLLVGTLANDAVLIFGSFLASFALGLYLQIAYTYTAECFPTRARASGFALSDGLGHGGGALGALVLPTVVSSISFFAGFAGIGVTGALAGLIALLGPRVSSRRLEHVSS
ncbi:MAG TPA: MFS transporter [Jatrophihabitans sp.]|nr:MFS transporter [Jatrophihabitans sp.]